MNDSDLIFENRSPKIYTVSALTEKIKELLEEHFDIVWVHRNFIRVDGQDYVFYTLSTTALLSDPVPIEDVYFHGERPYTMGYSVIETHKNYPSGDGELGANIQKEINEIANQRLDNVKFVLNKRWFVKRGGQVDIKSIVRK